MAVVEFITALQLVLFGVYGTQNAGHFVLRFFNYLQLFPLLQT